MVSKVKVDAIESTTGSGTIALNNQFSGMTASSMPTGSVLQVVQTVHGTYLNSTSGSFVDTGLAATITPKFSSSKIFVSVAAHGLAQNGASAKLEIALHGRGSIIALVLRPVHVTNGATFICGSSTLNYLDSPNNTSANVYKLQIRTNGGGDSVRYNDYHTGSDRSSSSITLMEIAG
jgi:hypothetical protein